MTKLYNQEVKVSLKLITEYMEIIGRDKISQYGDKSKLKIGNRQDQNIGLFSTLLITIIAGVIVAGIVYWFNWN